MFKEQGRSIVFDSDVTHKRYTICLNNTPDEEEKTICFLFYPDGEQIVCKNYEDALDKAHEHELNEIHENQKLMHVSIELERQRIADELKQFGWYETDHHTFDKKFDDDDDPIWSMWFDNENLKPVCQNQTFYKSLSLNKIEIESFQKYGRLLKEEEILKNFK